MNLTCVGIFRAIKIVKVKPHSSVKLVSCMHTADKRRTRRGFLGICFEIEVGYSHVAHSQPKNRPKQHRAGHCFVVVSGSKCDCPLNSALILLIIRYQQGLPMTISVTQRVMYVVLCGWFALRSHSVTHVI